MKIEKNPFCYLRLLFTESHTQLHTQIPAHRNQLIFVDADRLLFGCVMWMLLYMKFSCWFYIRFVPLFFIRFIICFFLILLHPTTLIQWHCVCGGREGRKGSTSTSPLSHRARTTTTTAVVCGSISVGT